MNKRACASFLLHANYQITTTCKLPKLKNVVSDSMKQ